MILSFNQNLCSQVIDHKTKITIDSEGTKSIERTILLQINSKETNWLSHIEIGHNPKQEFSFDYAQIIDLEGNTLRKLKKKDLHTHNDLSYQAFYQDDLITEFDLYWNQYPYQVEYAYTIVEEEYLYVAWWSPYLYTNLPNLNSSLEINTPVDYKIHIDQSEGIPLIESTAANRNIYYWESSIVEKTKDAIYSPPKGELIPIVAVVPSVFKYGVEGGYDSWSSLGLWQDKLNIGTDYLPQNEQRDVQDLIQGIEDEREIIKHIYHYLQDQTKYIYVGIDVGGMRSYPASYVSKNKYGDCKALTTYMKSMLKSVGIESYYTKIYAGKNPVRLNLDFPSHQSNHVILVIPTKNDTIWLENTSNSAPFNYLGTFTQNRYALAVDGENSRIIKTPKLQPSDVLVERNYEYISDDMKVWKGNIALTLRGESFEKFRYAMLNGNQKDQKNQITKHITIKGFELNDWRIEDFQRDSTYLKIITQGGCQSPIRTIANLEVINPLKIPIPDFEEPHKRKLDVRINFPINRSDRTIYTIKNLKGKEVKMPEEIMLRSDYGQYSTKYVMENNSIVVYEKFLLHSNDIQLENYSEFYSFIESIISQKKSSSILIK